PLKKSLFAYVVKLLKKRQQELIDIIKEYPKFRAPTNYAHIKQMVTDYLGYGNKMGEGWLLTGEMLELINSGVENIVCAQPFGCLPNHVVGKGMIRKIKQNYPSSNVVAIDYDPGATRINQENRIKLMLANARMTTAKTASAKETEPVSAADQKPAVAYAKQF
ncbi:MAG TPA: 2-hydroxyglutaryl-CoA dehydratase, partial [Clostridia bacterium]|nr:2-hydroxyglutaryl-CoA dehydratase [Clostridia bacterium]